MEKFLRSNNFARGLALFLAIALWLFVTGDNITRTTPAVKEYRDVSLQYINLQPGLAVAHMPATVDVTLEGNPEAFDGLSVAELEVFVDLSGVDTGSHLLPVSGKSPRGLDLLFLDPDRVTVAIETLQTAVYNVQPEFFGAPAYGWSHKSHTLEPPQVQLEAPGSLMEQVDRVVLPVDLSGKREDYQEEITPKALDSDGEKITGITIVPEKVNIFVELQRQGIQIH